MDCGSGRMGGEASQLVGPCVVNVAVRVRRVQVPSRVVVVAVCVGIALSLSYRESEGNCWTNAA